MRHVRIRVGRELWSTTVKWPTVTIGKTYIGEWTHTTEWICVRRWRNHKSYRSLKVCKNKKQKKKFKHYPNILARSFCFYLYIYNSWMFSCTRIVMDRYLPPKHDFLCPLQMTVKRFLMWLLCRLSGDSTHGFKGRLTAQNTLRSSCKGPAIVRF
jgi:hypothetical protein